MPPRLLGMNNQNGLYYMSQAGFQEKLLELEPRQALAGWPRVILMLHTGGVCKDQVASVLNEVGVICYIALTDQTAS